MEDLKTPHNPDQTSRDLEGYRMLYHTMNGIATQRFVAAGLLYATAGVVAGKSVDPGIDFGSRVGLVAVLCVITFAAAEIVGRLSAATRNLLDECRQVETDLDIKTGLGRRFKTYQEKYPGQTGTDAAVLTAELLCGLTAVGAPALLLGHADLSTWGSYTPAVAASVLTVGCVLLAWRRLRRRYRAWENPSASKLSRT